MCAFNEVWRLVPENDLLMHLRKILGSVDSLPANPLELGAFPQEKGRKYK